MNSQGFWSRFVAAGLPLLAVLGCSDDDSTGRRVPVYPARGQVLHKGKPLVDALVILRPVDKAAKDADVPQPTGRTDAEGKFLLHTYLGNDGAPAGSYQVGISVSPAFSETRNVMQKTATKPLLSKAAADAIGARYSNPDNSGLKAEIKPVENEVPPFNLN
jgi:hypothetical protein